MLVPLTRPVLISSAAQHLQVSWLLPLNLFRDDRLAALSARAAIADPKVMSIFLIVVISPGPAGDPPDVPVCLRLDGGKSWVLRQVASSVHGCPASSSPSR